MYVLGKHLPPDEAIDWLGDKLNIKRLRTWLDDHNRNNTPPTTNVL